jgi:hypothetical protein
VKASAGIRDGRTPAVVTQRFPGVQVGREFVAGEIGAQDVRPKVDVLAAPWLAIGGQVYVSFKPRASDVSSGAWTPWLTKLGVWLADHPGVKVIIWHEPEDDMSGAVFASMFNRCRTDIKAGWQGATVAYSAMAYHWRKGGRAATSPTGWQQVVADEYLVDVYSGVSFPETAILPEHPGFLGWFDVMVKPKLDRGEPVAWGMSERGFQAKDPNVRAATIRREADWLATLSSGAPTTQPPMLYLAWNTGGTENDADWILDATGEEAMRYLISRMLTMQDAPAPPPADPTVPDAMDRYDAGYADGRASRDSDVELARMQGRADGYQAAYSEMVAYANAKASGAA